MSTNRTLNPTGYPIPRAPKPMPINKRVTLAAVGTLGVAAALGLGGTIQAVAALSSVPGSTVIALGECLGPHGKPIPCPGPGGTVSGPGGGGAGSYGGGAFGNDPDPDTPPGSWPAEGGGGDCVGDEIVCHEPF
jgi:hypothetical protein